MTWHGDHMLEVDPFRQVLRETWRTYTLGEIAAATHVPPATLRKVMWGGTQHIQVRTAAKLMTGLDVLLPGDAMTYWERWETGMLGGKHRQGRNTTWRVWLVGGLLAIAAAVGGYYAYGEWM